MYQYIKSTFFVTVKFSCLCWCRCLKCKFPMCGNCAAEKKKNEEAAQEHDGCKLHTEKECNLLAGTGLGEQITDFEKEHIIYTCIWIHRM